eukprot:COSAG06_NODE_3635_length_5092_cov_417.533948_1_plen_61_part_00
MGLAMGVRCIGVKLGASAAFRLNANFAKPGFWHSIRSLCPWLGMEKRTALLKETEVGASN